MLLLLQLQQHCQCLPRLRVPSYPHFSGRTFCLIRQSWTLLTPCYRLRQQHITYVRNEQSCCEICQAADFPAPFSFPRCNDYRVQRTVFVIRCYFPGRITTQGMYISQDVHVFLLTQESWVTLRYGRTHNSKNDAERLPLKAFQDRSEGLLVTADETLIGIQFLADFACSLV